MKKFMTVLLVVAVMFTFSFGSAFASVDADTAAMAYAEKQQNEMAEFVAEKLADYVYKQDGTLVTPKKDGNLTKADIEATVAVIIAEHNVEILEKAITVVADGKFTTADEKAIAAVWADFAVDFDKVVFTEYGTTLYTHAIANAVAKAEALIAAVDASAYADAKKVEGYVSTLKTAVKEPAKNKTGLDGVLKAISTFEENMEKCETIVAQENNLAETKAAALKTIVEAAEAFKTAEAASLTSKIEKAKTPAAAAEYKTKLAALDANVAAVEAILVAKVEAVVIDEDTTAKAATTAVKAVATEAATVFNAADTKAFYAEVDKLAGIDLLIAYAESVAAEMKNAYSAETGLAIYNAATVDKTLAAAIEKIEALEVTSYSQVDTAMKTVKAADEAKALADAIAVGKEAITTGSYAATKWVGENKEAVEAIQKDYTAKLDKAADQKEIDALVKAAKEAMNAYLTKAQVTKLADNLADVYTEYTTKLTNYAKGVVAVDLNGKYEGTQVADAVEDAMDMLKAAIIAEQDADMTDDEAKAIIEANYAEALAIVEGIKTDDALAAEKKAVEAAIDALATTPTLENAAEYLAVAEMVEAYEELAGAPALSLTKTTKLTNYVTRLKNLAVAEVEAAIKALPTVITVADKAAVEAAREAVEALAEAWDGAAVTADKEAKLAAAEKTIREAQTLSAAKLVAALPAVITLADKADVEAARAAFDAIDEEGQEAFSATLLKKLEAAEGVIAKLDVYTDADAKAFVQDLKVVARSEKTAKENVKVTLYADVEELIENGYTVKYKFYKSEYSNKKFGKSVKTSEENVCTFTKGVKGTKYFYKAVIVVENAEGEVVAKTPLSQCLYACRTWSK